jgi:hypothetical protein
MSLTIKRKADPANSKTAKARSLIGAAVSVRWTMVGGGAVDGSMPLRMPQVDASHAAMSAFGALTGTKEAARWAASLGQLATRIS